jgi:hypothetical protein
LKRTWVFRACSGDAAEVMASAASVTAAAKALGVDRSTVHRWIRAQKIPPPGGSRRRHVQQMGITAEGIGSKNLPAPEGWAASVRAAYALSTTEAALVTMADVALALAGDVALKPADRLSAMARFARLVQQLDLEVPGGEVETIVHPRPAWPLRVIS